MRSVRVLRNIVTNYLRFFIAGVIAFVITPAMVHGLGDGGYGLWVTVFSLTGYFGLFDQGIRPSLVRYVSRDHARGDLDGVRRTVNSAIVLYTGVGVVALAATVIAAATFGRWLKLDPAQLESARAVVLIAGASVALGFPLGVFGATLSGLQRYDVANGIGIVIGVARALAFVAVLRLGGGVTALAWASLAMNLLGHALSALAVRRLLPDLSYGRRWVDLERLRLIAAYSGYAFLGALAGSIAFQTDALVITAFMGAAAVTPFALAAGLVDNARSLVYAATWVLSPTASEFEALGETPKLHAMAVTGTRYSVLVSWPVLWGLLIFGGNLLATWVGAKYQGSAALLTILTVPTFLALPLAAAAAVLFGVSRHRGVVVLSTLNAVLNLGLSILWVKRFGLTGVAMGTAVPLLLVSGIAMAVYTCRALALPAWRYLGEGFVQPGLVSLAFAIPATLAQALWHPIGWGPLAAACIGSWLVFAAVAWRFGVSAPERLRWTRAVPALFRMRPPAPAGTSRLTQGVS